LKPNDDHHRTSSPTNGSIANVFNDDAWQLANNESFDIKFEFGSALVFILRER
jgi:hypothetical protein